MCTVVIAVTATREVQSRRLTRIRILERSNGTTALARSSASREAYLGFSEGIRLSVGCVDGFGKLWENGMLFWEEWGSSDAR